MPHLTHANGAPGVNDTHTQTAGSRCQALLWDIWLIGNLARFDREVVPERRTCAKGSGASGLSNTGAGHEATQGRSPQRSAHP